MYSIYRLVLVRMRRCSKKGLEIRGIGVVDLDLHECMMQKAVQTTLDYGNEDMSLYDWYAKILEDHNNLSIGRLKVLMANAYYAQRIIDVFEKNPNTQLNHEIVRNIWIRY